MSFALLWLELLAAFLLWIALIAALASRIRLRGMFGLAMFAAILPPAIILALALYATGYFKFALNLMGSWFGYALWLAIFYAIGMAVIVVMARRRPEAGMARTAADWPRGKLLAALLIVTAIAAMTLWNMDLSVRNEASSLRSEAGALMLEALPQVGDDSQNAAIVYEKAFALMDEDAALKRDDSILNEEHPDPNSPATVAMLDRHARVFKLLREATALPGCRFDRDFARPRFDLLLPELGQIRIASSLTCLDARHQIAVGNAPLAIADINAVYRLARAAGSEPCQISVLVCDAVDRRATETLQEILPYLKPQELAQLNIGDESLLKRCWIRGLQGEEAFGLSAFGDLAAGRLSFDTILPNERGATVASDLMMPYRVFFLAADMHGYEDLMEAYRKQAQKPHYTLADVDEKVQIRSAGIVSWLITPAMNHCAKAHFIARGFHIDAELGIAVARYRAEHGALPQKLADVVPQYIDDIPVDPFDGRPMRYVILGGNALIYSVGPDRKDDGGKDYDTKTELGDLVFLLLPAASADSQPARLESGSQGK